jgi:hypothetical protein
MRAILTAICGAAILLAACVSTTTPTPQQAAFQTLRNETDALRDRHRGAPVTPWFNIPTRGGALYQGTAVLNLATPRPSQLLGEATITADFARNDIDGVLGNFVGRLDGQPTRFYAGTIDFSDGNINTSATNMITADIGGLLTGGGDVVAVGGGVVGNFLGAAAPQAVELKERTGTFFSYNGGAVGGNLRVLAD